MTFQPPAAYRNLATSITNQLYVCPALKTVRPVNRLHFALHALMVLFLIQMASVYQVVLLAIMLTRRDSSAKTAPMTATLAMAKETV